MEPFDLRVNPARIIFGTGAIGRTGEMIRELGCSRALVLSTPHQKAEAEKFSASLGDLAAGVYAGATMHTPVEVTGDALAVLREVGTDRECLSRPLALLRDFAGSTCAALLAT